MRNLRQKINVSLLMAGLAVAPRLLAAEGVPELCVMVYNDARFATTVMQPAEALVTDIYRHAGVSLKWVYILPDSPALHKCRLKARVRILPRSAAIAWANLRMPLDSPLPSGDDRVEVSLTFSSIASGTSRGGTAFQSLRSWERRWRTSLVTCFSQATATRRLESCATLSGNWISCMQDGDGCGLHHLRLHC